MHDQNCFVTLTYDNEHVPSDHSLRYSDVQLFLKRLRKKVGPLRFFCCGEYGSKLGRPHYHLILFGVYFDDAIRLPGDRAHCLYKSETLARLWPLGFSSFGAVSSASAAYVASYSLKKFTGTHADEHYAVVDSTTGEWIKRVPEFARMSTSPGIGKPFLDKYLSDVAPRDYCIVEGKKRPLPRYYMRKLLQGDWKLAADIQSGRFDKLAEFDPDDSPEKLAVEELCINAQLKHYTRKTL